MSSQAEIIESHRENAEVYTDPLICKQKSLELLEEINLPSGLFPLDDLVEVGRNRETGFVWLKQEEEKEHIFKKVRKQVIYGTEITSFVQDRGLKKLTGIKAKELAFWINVSDISIKDPESKKITFAIPSGIRRSYPVSAFEEEDKEEEDKEEEKKEDEKEKDKEEEKKEDEMEKEGGKGEDQEEGKKEDEKEKINLGTRN